MNFSIRGYIGLIILEKTSQYYIINQDIDIVDNRLYWVVFDSSSCI
jgi:hypothetical protein